MQTCFGFPAVIPSSAEAGCFCTRSSQVVDISDNDCQLRSCEPRSRRAAQNPESCREIGKNRDIPTTAFQRNVKVHLRESPLTDIMSLELSELGSRLSWSIWLFSACRSSEMKRATEVGYRNSKIAGLVGSGKMVRHKDSPHMT